MGYPQMASNEGALWDIPKWDIPRWPQMKVPYGISPNDPLCVITTISRKTGVVLCKQCYPHVTTTTISKRHISSCVMEVYVTYDQEVPNVPGFISVHLFFICLLLLLFCCCFVLFCFCFVLLSGCFLLLLFCFVVVFVVILFLLLFLFCFAFRTLLSSPLARITFSQDHFTRIN